MRLPEKDFEAFVAQGWGDAADSAHDPGHLRRVAALCRYIGAREGGDPDIYIPAAWLHDLVNLPKDHPDRARASTLSAEKAAVFLRGHGYDEDTVRAISHAIAAHSFSAGIAPETPEAQIVQDADRLEALGAIGVARVFAVSGALGRPLFHADDPLALGRAVDDRIYALDHFEVKLFRIAETMQTETGRALAAERVAFMRDFRDRLAREVLGDI